jgi:hypothetical protein
MYLNQTRTGTLMLGAIAACTLFLSACSSGGGGGAGSTAVEYTGSTAAAEVGTEAAAAKLSSTVIGFATSGPESVPLFGVGIARGGTSVAERLRNLAEIVGGMELAAAANGRLAGATVSGTETGCTGSAAMVVTYEDLDGSGTYTEGDRFTSAAVTFSNFREKYDDGTCDTITYNGAATIAFAYDDPSNAAMATSLTFRFTDLSTTDESGATERMNGAFTFTVYPEVAFSMSLDYQEAGGEVYRVKDYTVVFGSGGITSIEGILCDPVDGCIEVVTMSTFTYDAGSCPGGEPVTGMLYIYGYDWGSGARTAEYISVDANSGSCATYQVCWTGTNANCLANDPAW